MAVFWVFYFVVLALTMLSLLWVMLKAGHMQAHMFDTAFQSLERHDDD